MVTPSSTGVNAPGRFARFFGLAVLTSVLLGGGPGHAQTADGGPQFHLSPPAVAPAGKTRVAVNTDLRDLQDAYGLALLVADDASAKRIASLLTRWRRAYQPLLQSDPVLKKIDATNRRLFSQLLGDRSRPSAEFARIVRGFDGEKMRSTLILWLRNLFIRRGVSFREDLGTLSREDLEDICLQARSFDTLQGLSSWRYRVLAWRYRDSEVRRLFADRDDRLRFLTPIRIPVDGIDPATRTAIRRYLAMLRNLRLQVIKDRTMPYDRFRTLEGLLRGLRYMDTIRRAAELTGVDHRMMTRLFIQESEFIHHRVSWAGAFSLAQFLNIAIKDVWLFRKGIPGSSILLKGVTGWEDLRSRMLADPRWAIKASCLYFRRLRDEVILRLGKEARRTSRSLLNLMTVEMFVLRRGVMENATEDAMIELSRSWPLSEVVLLPVAPLAGGVVPDARVLLTDWVERTIRDLADVRITEGVFRERLTLLHSALGLAAYNAGMSNLLKAGKRRNPFKTLSFPLQITENRNYVDDILDGTDILQNVSSLGADVQLMEWETLMDLAEQACKRAKVKKK